MEKEEITIEEALGKAEACYIEYWNNFLTVEKFAEHFEVDLSIANHLIDLGRVVYNLDT